MSDVAEYHYQLDGIPGTYIVTVAKPAGRDEVHLTVGNCPVAMDHEQVSQVIVALFQAWGACDQGAFGRQRRADMLRQAATVVKSDV